MERRDFMRLGALGAVGGLFLPALVRAAPAGLTGAGGLFYTKDAPGRWKGKEATHTPSIAVTKADGTATVIVVTPHEMKAYEHYIVKHVLLDKDFGFLGEHMFDPTKDKQASSFHKLEKYSGTLYALSFCNKHDLWLASAEV